ncbi:T9SS type A sorting domain-containing protein [Aquimarina gracilis]|uniref:T9SS type A sorting domain-containing protein n=1 Tax=Aquimarina gracilis TaxID=874422 RepID=A0ABU5ZZX5_9FLAO|nr:T9SS type A sorting domain-containing protein [Aquimarina gracilis]MEB3347386.1 T9SS type A sorting domain-containing protein [Aquimarina gracilis]
MIRKLQLGFTFLLLSTALFSQDQVFNTDVIVQGSMQIGGDAQNNYSFGSDTFVMSENNLRMLFEDTSASASFPGNDWRFTFNDNSNGGDNYFSIDDVTGGKKPFRIDAGAPNNAFRIADNGNIGIGTNSPGDIELNILDNDTPTLRLGQNGGFGTQVWDVAGNEANFFIRDVTNGSKLPFRIQPKTPQNTLTLRSSGTVGIGTWGPNSNASLHMSATNKGLLINRMTTTQRTDFAASLDAGENGMMVYDNEENKLYLWNGTEWVTDTDSQDLELTDNTLSLSNDNTTVDLAKYLDNTDAQDLELSGNTLSLTNDATSVDLSKYLDNTDNQTVDVFQLNGNDLELSLERDGVATQTVDLSGYLDNTDAQDLELSGNSLSLTNDATSVDLSKYLDNTDAQELSFSNNILRIANGVTTIDLSGYLDNTDAQELSFSNNVLSIANGTNTIDLSGYLDNTDSQTLVLNDTDLSISGGNSIDLSVLRDGTGTDNQTLSLNSDVLSISNGNTIDLSTYSNTDRQNLTAASLRGSNLTIEIENGASVTVDLSPVVTSLETELDNAQQEIADLAAENQTQQTVIEDLIARIEALEQNTGGGQDPTSKGNTPVLYQNIPNPFNGTSTIKYYLPKGITNASIVFSNAVGQVFSTVALQETGNGELNINSDGLAKGTYFYTLYVGGRKITSKKMVIK